MGMVDYLSRFSSAAAPETSHFDENFTVATVRMIKEALYSTHQLNSRGQTVKKFKKNWSLRAYQPTLSHARVSHPIEIEGNFLNMKLIDPNVGAHKRAWLHATGGQPIRNINFVHNKLCSQSAKYSCLFKQNLKFFNPTNEKLDPKHSTIVNTSTQSGNVNLNVVLSRVPNQPPSLSYD